MIYKNQILSRMHVDRKEGGMGMIEIDLIYKREIVRLGEYLKMSEDRFLQWVHQHEQSMPSTISISKKKQDYLDSSEIRIPQNVQWEERTGKMKVKYLKERFKEKRENKHITQWKQQVTAKDYREILELPYIDKEKSVAMFCRGTLRAEEERMIRAAQDKTVRTKWQRKHIEKENISDLCRICNHYPETIPHIIAGCEILLNRGSYTDRHNIICKYIHFKLCHLYAIETETNSYYKHNPPEIAENNQVLLLYDYSIPTDIYVQHNRPDLVVCNKLQRKCYILEIGVPFDGNVTAYELEKNLKYQRLKNEISRMWEMEEVIVVPLVIGALGILKDSFTVNIEKLPVKISTLDIQISAVRKTIQIIRTVLGCS